MNLTDFKGLNNVSDPLRLPLGWMVQADNVNITDSAALERREGYTLSQAGAFTGGYATLNGERLYLVTPMAVQDISGENIAAVTVSAPMYWCEVNENVYFNNGTDSGVIRPDNSVLPWRQAELTETRFLGADGKELGILLDSLPLGVDHIQAWGGRIYAAQYMPSENQSVIWFSQPLGYHLFNLDTDFIMVPGKVTMLAPHDSALLIGTDAKTYAYTPEALVTLADYGVVPGQHWARDDLRILFWTARGLCAALPFTNLTEKQVSVAPGVLAGGCVVEAGGQKRYLAVLQQGGVPFNAL